MRVNICFMFTRVLEKGGEGKEEAVICHGGDSDITRGHDEAVRPSHVQAFIQNLINIINLHDIRHSLRAEVCHSF